MKMLKIPIEKNYNRNLLKTVAFLYGVHSQLSTLVVNLSTSEKMKEFNKQSGEKLALNCDDDDSKDLTDTNIQHLKELIEFLKEKSNILLNKSLQ